MKIGLLFGSFNPIHNGHISIARYFLEHTALETIWFIVSPQNPFKKEDELLSAEQRLGLLKKALENETGMQASDAEINMPVPSFTIYTLNYLAKEYPGNEFSIIMGTDNFTQFHKWKDHIEIVNRFKIYVYPRKGNSGGEFQNHPNVQMIHSPLLDISAGMIREIIKKGETNPWIPEKVFREIQEKGYYR